MKTRCAAARGFSLIEVVVGLGVSVALLLVTAPLMPDWAQGAQTADARAKLVQGFSTAKGLALRNSGAVDVVTAALAAQPAAGLRVERADSGHTVLACNGDPTAAGCTPGGASVVWSATYPAAVSTTLGGAAVATGAARSLALDNRGIVTTTNTTFTLQRGGSGNDQTGSLQ